MEEKLSKEEINKDRLFAKLAELSEEMIEDHGKDFAMGALVLAAQWIAKGESGPPQTDPRH
ncbi:hypothetical protein [Roseobacter weihaiensis]|uniref:hypothetical protein n=1 Tax=Roseobacter weihaiensis TaxID=2763262 RepID=UPI001D0A0D09|nr:hypothetical protein [Roseobacter sp. H9]